MTNTIVQLTNTMQQLSILPFASGESWFSRYASEIIVAIITAALAGGGAVLWQYFAQPFLSERQKKREATKRKHELLKTLGNVQPSLEWSAVYGECIAITLKNNTTKPVVIREVALLPHPGGRFIM